jgi:hypothetical protein
MMGLKYFKYCTFLQLLQHFTYLSKTKKKELSVG